MANEFLDAIMQRAASTGFDTQYSNKYARPTLEKLAADVRAKMDIASKTDRPATRKRLVNQRSQILKLTPEEQAYKNYDDARQKLTTFLGETLNTPKGVSDGKAALTEIVNAASRAQREQQYAAPQYSSTSETARSPMEQKTTAAAPMPAAPTEAPAKPEFDGSALASAMEKAPAVQPAEKAPTEAAAMEAYKTIEAGQAPKATVVSEQPTAEVPEDRLMGLFRKTMGSEFDPKSRMDRSKLDDLRSFVSSNPDALNKSDTKIALDYYRSKA